MEAENGDHETDCYCDAQAHHHWLSVIEAIQNKKHAITLGLKQQVQCKETQATLASGSQPGGHKDISRGYQLVVENKIQWLEAENERHEAALSDVKPLITVNTDDKNLNTIYYGLYTLVL